MKFKLSWIDVSENTFKSSPRYHYRSACHLVCL